MKESGATYFECGSVKLQFDAPKDEKTERVGFVPLDQQLGTQLAAESGDDEDVPPQYRKVFHGRAPRFGQKPKG